jgi:hypothetical protein
MEPEYEDTANHNFHLTAGSPCIDAGDPSFPLDPDGTVTDMGAYWFNQIGVAEAKSKYLLNWWYIRYTHNLFGSPEMEVWTDVPKDLIVEHIDAIPANTPVDFQVYVQDVNGPLANALVTLYKDPEGYLADSKLTGPGGYVVFQNLVVPTTGIMKVTVTARNHIPYQGEVDVFEFDVDISTAHTAYTEGRKIIRKPGSEDLHLSYTFLDFPGANGPDDWTTYAFSSDGGTTWEEGQNIKQFTRNPSIGLTFDFRPCVAYRNSYEPYLLEQPAVIYFARYDDPDWALYTIDSFPVVGTFYPSVSPPSIVIDANDICHMVYSGVLYAPGKAYVVYKRFDAFNPSTETVIIDSAIVPEDWEPSSPCVATQLGFPHIVYDFPPEAGEPEPEVWYRCLTETGWSNKVNISNSYSLPSEHPFIYLTNEKAVVVWSEEETAGNEESREIWKGERFLNHPPEDWITWREVETPNQASDWPIITANNEFLVWSEHMVIEEAQNWEILYKSPTYGSGNLSNSPHTQSFCPSCEWRQTVDGVYLYTAFTEQYEYEPEEPYIFGIKMKREEFQPPTIPLYTIYGGSEVPSPYCIERDGHIAYDDYPVDYDTTELVYKFTGLKSDSRYAMVITAYHESSGEWWELIKVDNMPKKVIRYKAGIPKTVPLLIQKSVYEDDGEVIIELAKILGDFAMLHKAYLYEFEEERGGGGPQTVATYPQNLVFGFTVLPNIVTHSAKIRCTIPKSQKVTLKLYDVVGRKVLSIVDGIVESGIHTHNLNAANLSQGVYFLTFTGETEIKKQKLLIIR